MIELIEKKIWGIGKNVSRTFLIQKVPSKIIQINDVKLNIGTFLHEQIAMQSKQEHHLGMPIFLSTSHSNSEFRKLPIEILSPRFFYPQQFPYITHNLLKLYMKWREIIIQFKYCS